MLSDPLCSQVLNHQPSFSVPCIFVNLKGFIVLLVQLNDSENHSGRRGFKLQKDIRTLFLVANNT